MGIELAPAPHEALAPDEATSAYAEALREVTEAATVKVPTVAVLVRQSERVVREAIAAGELPSIRLGRSIRVPSAPLRRMLGIEAS